MKIVKTFKRINSKTYFSSGGGGISWDGLRGGVFSGISIIASGASGGGRGLTVLLSIFFSFIEKILYNFIYIPFQREILFRFSFCLAFFAYNNANYPIGASVLEIYTKNLNNLDGVGIDCTYSDEMGWEYNRYSSIACKRSRG